MYLERLGLNQYQRKKKWTWNLEFIKQNEKKSLWFLDSSVTFIKRLARKFLIICQCQKRNKKSYLEKLVKSTLTTFNVHQNQTNFATFFVFCNSSKNSSIQRWQRLNGPISRVFFHLLQFREFSEFFNFWRIQIFSCRLDAQPKEECSACLELSPFRASATDHLSWPIGCLTSQLSLRSAQFSAMIIQFLPGFPTFRSIMKLASWRKDVKRRIFRKSSGFFKSQDGLPWNLIGWLYWLLENHFWPAHQFIFSWFWPHEEKKFLKVEWFFESQVGLPWSLLIGWHLEF